MTRPISFEQAKAQYVHRFTCEHVPAWSQQENTLKIGNGPALGTGKFYAPQYATDREWYEKTLFPGEGFVGKREKHCSSANQSWPKGHWLDAPYRRGT